MESKCSLPSEGQERPKLWLYFLIPVILTVIVASVLGIYYQRRNRKDVPDLPKKVQMIFEILGYFRYIKAKC